MPLNRFRQLRLSALCLVLGCSAWMAAAVAEPAGARARVRTSSRNQQDNEEPMQTFKAQVNVVNLFFNVKDKHGMLIPNLTKDDFQVFEDGKPQTIKYFSAESTSH